ncbi:MAG: hypothetical protein WBW81_14295 [Methylocella sp.]
MNRAAKRMIQPRFISSFNSLHVDATRADEIVRPSHVDAALLGHPRQHRARGRAGSPAHDRAEALLWVAPGPGQHRAQLNSGA